MSIVKIKGGAYKNVDEFALTDNSSILIDGFVDELENSVKRPGLLQWVKLGGAYPVQGIRYDAKLTAFLVTCLGVVYKVSILGVVSTPTGGATVGLSLPTIFASDGTTTWMAGGTGRLVKFASGSVSYDNATASAGPPAVSASPTNCTHVAYIDGYIVVNQVGDNKFYFTDPVTRATWPLYSYAQLMSSPDPIIAIHNFLDNLFLFSSSRLEIWRNDGVSPFSINSGGFINSGLSAPYSVIQVGIGGGIYWLDDKRRFVLLQGYMPVPVSGAYEKVLQNMSVVSDCIASEIAVGGQHFIVLAFPTADNTLVFNYISKQWQEWGSWSAANNIYNRFICDISMMANTSVTGNNVSVLQYASAICGDRLGNLYKMTDTVGSDQGLPIRMLRRTGHITHETFNKKRVKRLTIRAKAGTMSQTILNSWSSLVGAWSAQTKTWDQLAGPIVTSPSNSKFQIRMNDDNRGWGNWIDVPLDGTEEGNFITLTLRKMGMYYTRQYEILHYDNTAGVIFVEVEEEAEILTR